MQLSQRPPGGRPLKLNAGAWRIACHPGTERTYLPGTPVMRYGDELGMGDNLALPERVCGRTPMQWSTEPNGGFTKSDKPIVPVISEGPYGYHHVNAAEQRRDPNSLLNWMERVIRMRKEVPEVGWGQFKVLKTGDSAVLGLRYDWKNNSVLFLHNFAGEPREIELSIGLKGETNDRLINLLTTDHSQARKLAPLNPTRSPMEISSCGVCREYLPRPPQTLMPSSLRNGVSPRLRAPMTLVVMPDECQSIPMTAPKD
jgi:hypothetical protein